MILLTVLLQGGLAGLARLASEWSSVRSWEGPKCDEMEYVSSRSNNHLRVTMDDGFIVKLITVVCPCPPEQLS